MRTTYEVRLWVIDHWSDWVPAQPDLTRSLTFLEVQDLREGQTLTRHGVMQIRQADASSTEAHHDLPSQPNPLSQPQP